MPNCVRRMRWKGYASLQRFRQCGRCAPAVLHSIKYLRSRGARGGRPLVRNQAIFLPFRQKDSPLLQHRNKGLSCRVRFHHPNLLFVSFSRRVQRPLCCTRTPTAVKGNAYARFRTTACRLRSHRTLSASGRFSTSDSPPSIPLNLYSKGAAPREGLLLFSGSGYSIAVRLLFVNDLINKN